MNYKIYKLRFKSAVHFGNKTLASSEHTICADTLFAALCQEAVKMETLEFLIEYAKEGQIVLSDTFPYIEQDINGKKVQEFYVPKPLKLNPSKDNQGDSTIKKLYKKINYVPLSRLDDFINSKFTVEELKELVANLSLNLGTTDVKVSAAVRGEEETVPYRVGTYRFKENNGLYVIVGFEDEDSEYIISEAFNSLQYQGIGGKKNTGLGRFELIIEDLPVELETSLNLVESTETLMLLSCALPLEDEITTVINDADNRYTIMKRSGFVASDKYSNTHMRKKDIYVLKAGSCLKHTFKGDIYDVSAKGNHPVYRYAKPMFMEVKCNG